MPYCRIAARILKAPGVAVLAAGGLCTSAISLAQALPFNQVPPAPRGGVILVQQAAEENAQQGAPFQELNEALAAARAKLEELTTAAEVATIAAELRRELQASRSEVERLTGQLARAQEAQQAAERRAEQAAADLTTKEEAMSERLARDLARLRAAEQEAANAQRLRQQLEESETARTAAEQAREQTAARMAEVQEVVESALEEAARLGQQLEAAEERLSAANARISDMSKERDDALGVAQSLRQELATIRTRLEEAEGENASMAEQIALLREAASTATDAARANLLAVEDKIKLLNEALSDLQPAPGEAEDVAPEAGPSPEEGAPAETPAQSSDLGQSSGDASDAAVERLPSSLAQPQAMRTYELSALRAANAAAPGAVDEATPEDGAAPGEAVERANDDAEGPLTLAQFTAALPLEQRVQTQNLLADLKAKTTDGGLLLTVPGEELFAVDSEEIESGAYETLAKAAEVISIYGDREVLITGHTDALGDAQYNQQLSERRADLVREFLVENFDVGAARLETTGAGEDQPIASNATPAGRRANRRVEVLIMN